MPETSAFAAVRIELLGAPSLLDAGGRRVPLERKSAALLALLRLQGARNRAAVAALLWPQATPALARNSLRQRLFKLQRSAAAEVVVGHEELRLSASVATDIDDAEQRLRDDPHAQIGELLEGQDFGDTLELAEWVDAARVGQRRQLGDWLARFASSHEARQQVVPALHYAKRLLGLEPLLEIAHRRVMRLHYLRGDRAAAMAAYEQCRKVLNDQLGIHPDRETVALAQTIAEREPALDHPAAALRAPTPALRVLRPPRLIGREIPLARLRAALVARRVVLLDGEPGIGKSRLLHALAEGDSNLLLAGSLAGDARVPYALLARIATAAVERHSAALPDWVTAELARLVPTLAAAPAARLEALRLQQAFSVAVGAWAGTGLQGLAVDDLHHADEASLECLLALASTPAAQPAAPSLQPQAAPVAWLFSVRSQEMPALLQQWLAANETDAVDSLQLELLDTQQVHALLESLQLDAFEPATWATALARHSGGNPLFALETLRALLALVAAGQRAPSPDAAALPVPAALGALIERRLAATSEPALRLARVAALAGADFDAAVAAAVLEAHPLDLVEPWRELEATQLLSHGRFSHDLIAEAVLRALPEGIAQVLHARLAEVLHSAGRGAARVAPHWAEAQQWRRAGESYVAAAREARSASRRSDEATMWRHAAQSFERAGQLGMAFDARADSVECVILCQGIEAASSLVDRLDTTQRTEPQRLRALTARACVQLMGGQAREAEAVAREALHTATRLQAQWPRFEAARLLAVALAQAGRADEALNTIEPFRELVVEHGDAEQRHRFWADYAYALKAAQRASDTAEALRQAMHSAEEAGDNAELATLTSNLALIEGNLGRVEQALDHARRARALNDPLGLAVGPPAGAIELYVSVHEGALGRYSDALRGFERAQACFAGNPGTIWIGLTANHLAHVLMHLGQHARARQALAWPGPASPLTEARRQLLQVRLDRALGQRGEHSIERMLEAFDGSEPVTLMLGRLEGTLGRDSEQPAAAAEAAATCSAVVEQAESQEHLALGMRARLLRLRHLTHAGTLQRDDVDDTVQRLRQVHPADTYFAEAWWIACRAYDALGLPQLAEQALREAHAWVVERAWPQVPDAFRHAFLHRNTINRELLAAASRRPHLGAPADGASPTATRAATTLQ